jgi:hypothetical protein
VSNTGAVCPRNRGICSGSRPFSLTGMTANAPPPLASQLTARYSGFAWTAVSSAAFHPKYRGSNLHQVCIPSIATDVEVVVALFLPRGLSKDVSWFGVSFDLVPCPADGEAYDISTRAQNDLPSGINMIDRECCLNECRKEFWVLRDCDVAVEELQVQFCLKLLGVDCSWRLDRSETRKSRCRRAAAPAPCRSDEE